MAKISVIVPVYKVERYLHRCVQSILAQTRSDLEVILVDDGSPDGCGVICDGYAERDGRVKVIHKGNGGLSSARNAGLDIATGEYIGFVDSDDHIEPTMYETLLTALERSGADMAICNYAYVDERGQVDAHMQALSDLTDGVLSREEALKKLDTATPAYSFYVTAWNKLYKNSLFDGLRFPEGKLHEDEFTAHGLVGRCQRIATVGQVLYRYVQRSGSIMNTRVTARSLDGVYALFDRYGFYTREGMGAQAKAVLVSAVWKLCVLLEQLPRDAKKEAAQALKRLLPVTLRVRPKSALRLAWHWLRYGLRSARAERCLRRYKTRCAQSLLLLDTPEHENLGDHAIALAQLQFLQETCPGIPILEVTAGQLDGNEAEYAACTPEGKTVLIHGGGFLGCLWPREELRFRALLKAFYRQKVVVFPQTVTFDTETEAGRAFLRASREAYCAHPDLTIFVRETQSLAFLQTHFPGVKTHLVPDTVTLLRLPLPRYEREGALLCLRGDLEKRLTDTDLAFIRGALAQWNVRTTDTVLDRPVSPGQRKREVRNKLKEFACARLVITDRLHGMVFAALTATPCIALGNCNGKVRGVYRWLEHLGYIRYVEDTAQLEQTLQQLEVDRQWHYRPEALAEQFESLRTIVRQ